MDTPGQPSRTWEEIQALKDDLFERAKVGEITGDEADAEAIRLGLVSLSGRPGPDEFRPEAQTHWTLAMAVAWIAYLDLDEVREWSAPFRAECRVWRWQRWRVGFDGPIHEGWHLEERSKPTLARLTLGGAHNQAAGGKPLSMSIHEAREALWMALREGFFSATGIDTETSRRAEIPALDWNELVPVEERNETDEVRRGLLGHGYRDVLLPSRALRGFWRKVEAPRHTLPPIMPPSGLGYIPLFCAVQWIATEGGKRDFDPLDNEVWAPAYTALLDAIASMVVGVLGSRGGQTVPVPPHLFAGIRVAYPFTESPIGLILSDDLVLRSTPYIDDEHWRNGFDDVLSDRGGDRWKRLMVEKSHVRALWPFTTEQAQGADQRTGLPGRPAKAKHLIDDELQRRAEAGLLAPTVSAEAAALHEWLALAHPSQPRPTPRVIENNIRAAYRQLRATNR